MRRSRLVWIGLWAAFYVGTARAGEEPSPVDPRFQSPRATVRTFYAAISASRAHPSRIASAVACMDLGGAADDDSPEAGKLAAHLELILRDLDVRTFLLPHEQAGKSCTVVERDGIRVVLERGRDGSWRFDRATVANVLAMRRALWDIRPAPPASGNVPFERHSPRATMQTYLDAMRRGDTESAATCLDLGDIPPPARATLGAEHALKLHEIFDRIGPVLEQDLSDHADGESVTLAVDRAGQICLGRVASGERAGEWLFDRATVRSIENLYDAHAEMPIAPEVVGGAIAAVRLSAGLWLRRTLPSALTAPITGMRHWRISAYQVLGLGLLAGLLFALRRSSIGLLVRALHRLWALFHSQSAAIELGRVALSLWWVLAAEIAMAAASVLDLRGRVAMFVLSCLAVARVWIWAWLACEAVGVLRHGLGAWRARHGRRAAVSEMLLPLMALVARIAIVLGALAWVLQLFEVHVATIVAGLGVGGVACALAAQDTLKNLFGSITLIADRTFFVGDWIRIGDTEGMVESVGLRSTRIRSYDDALLTIPNAALTTVNVTNFGARRYRAAISVLYSTPPDLLTEFRDGIVSIIEASPHTLKRGYDVRVHDLADSSINLLVTVFFDVADNLEERAAREALIVEIIRLAERIGVSFAFPTRTLHVASTALPSLQAFRAERDERAA